MTGEYYNAVAARVIKEFRWWNYGLDGVSEAESDDWADDLAAAVVDAILKANRLDGVGVEDYLDGRS